MRKYLSKLALAGGAAVAALALGAGTAGAATTSAPPPPPVKNATIACGYFCSSWQSVGDQFATGTLTTIAIRNGAAPYATQPSGAIVRQRTDDNTAYREDFSYTGPTCAVTTSDPAGLCPVWRFLRKGWISGTSYAALNYPDDYALELEYTPDGVSTGECVGVRAEAYDGERVRLERCGLNANTLWVVDTNNTVFVPTEVGDGVPLVNGSNRYATVPEVLTADGRNVGPLTVTSEASQQGRVDDNQLWYEQDGPAA